MHQQKSIFVEYLDKCMVTSCGLLLADVMAADVDEKLLGFIELVHIYCQNA